MRTLIQITIPAEKGNQAVQDGSLQRVLENVLGRIRPEAAYFGTLGTGKRSAFFVFDLADTAQIPTISEPFFTALDAEIDFCPVMNQEDLMRGLKELSQAG